MFMKTTIESLEFPIDVKKKLKMKVSTTNLKLEFFSGHIIQFNKTNLSVRKPHKIIVENHNKNVLVALLYDDSDKIYLSRENVIISLTKYITMLNELIYNSCVKTN